MPMPTLPESTTSIPQGTDLAGLMRSSTFAAAADRSNLLQVRPNQAFFLRHHLNAWRVSTTLATPLLLPDVTKMVIAPGVNGIRTRRKNEQPEATYIDAVMKAQRKSWTFLNPADPIPAECLPEGVPPGSYIREMDCQGLIVRTVGIYYAEAWEVPIATLPDKKQRFRFDTPKYERWLRFLVESGQIQPPIDGILAALQDQVQDHADRVETMNLNESVRTKWMKFRQAIADNYFDADPAQRKTDEELQETLAGYLTADAKPKPKPKRKKRGRK